MSLQVKPYSEYISDIYSQTLSKQLFIAVLQLTTQYAPEEKSSLLTFQYPRRLLVLDDNTIMYGGNNEHICLIPPEGTTHIYYETSATEEDGLVLPLALKVVDDSFSVYTDEGWVQYSYPLSCTPLQDAPLYVL